MQGGLSRQRCTTPSGKGFPSWGKRRIPYLKVRTEGNKKSIEKIPSRPTGLYVWVLFHLKLGLGRVPLNYRSIIINNTKKEMAKKKRQGGDREEEIKDSHSAPQIVNTDSCFIFNSFRVENAGCWWGCAHSFSLFFRFTTRIRNLRIHPTCR